MLAWEQLAFSQAEPCSCSGQLRAAIGSKREQHHDALLYRLLRCHEAANIQVMTWPEAVMTGMWHGP